VRIPLAAADNRLAVDKCVMGIRPEHVRFEQGPGDGVVPVEIAAETPLNEKTVTLARTHTGQEVLVSRPAETPGPAIGNGFISIDSEYALLFGYENGERILPATGLPETGDRVDGADI